MNITRRIAALAAVAVVGAAALSVGSVAADGDRGNRGNNNRPDCTRNNESHGSNYRYDRGGRLKAIALTDDGRLICFREDRPDRESEIGDVTGLTGDTALVGIDFRPANKALYGVGNAGGLYTVDPKAAVATKVAQLSVALAGASFGVDVNPAADALRVISDTGQNLRFSFANGMTFTDTALTNPPNAAAGVTGAAYTNNDLDPNTATTLFDIDSVLDQVAIQAPANSGQLSATGKLGVDTGPEVAFDIYSTIRNGATVDVRGLASLSVEAGADTMYEVSLLTGKATKLGHFDDENQIIGLAIPLEQR